MRGVGSVWFVLGLAAACGPVVNPPVDASDTTSDPTTSAPHGSTHGAVTTGPVGGTTGSTTAAPGSEVEVDEGVRLDLPIDMGPECLEEWPSGGCGIPSDRTTVTGTTPLGDFTTTRAVFGSWAGCGGVCEVDPNVIYVALLGESVLLEDLQPDAFNGPDETMILEIEGFNGGFEGPAGRPVVGLLAAHRDGVTDTIGGVEVVLDLLPTSQELSEPFDPQSAVVVTGSLAVDAPGWSVAGTFAARYCPDINAYVICE